MEGEIGITAFRESKSCCQGKFSNCFLTNVKGFNVVPGRKKWMKMNPVSQVL